MIGLRVECLTGHYGAPGKVVVMQNHATSPFAPPTTIKGFLESLCGAERGGLNGEFAYAFLGADGKGSILRRSHMWMSGPGQGASASDKARKTEHYRPTKVDTIVNPSYRIEVRGECVDRIRKALAGDVERYGILSLGTGEDAVLNIVEDSSDAPWVVPGTTYVLTTQTPPTVPSGKKGPLFEMTGTWSRFDEAQPCQVPEEAWYSL